jgi:hypothetical protein
MTCSSEGLGVKLAGEVLASGAADSLEFDEESAFSSVVAAG